MHKKDKSKATSGNVNVKSATRVLDIFEYFDEVRIPATIREVSDALGYPYSSATALLKNLVNIGYLEYDATRKTYFPSIRISLLGNWIEPGKLPVRELHKLLKYVSDETACTLILTVPSGVHAQYVKVLQANTDIRYYIKPGSRKLMAFSTAGRVMLAEMPENKSRALVEQVLQENQHEWAETADEIMAELQKIRRRGYALYTGLVTPKVSMLAMPIRMAQYPQSVAIGLAAPSDYLRANKQAFIDIIKSAIHDAGFDKTKGNGELINARSS